jgi:pantetheine-phosphate adenylyltransferase
VICVLLRRLGRDSWTRRITDLGPGGEMIASHRPASIESSRVNPCLRGLLKDIVAIYPGSFDPVTNGHLDLIHRGSKLFDKLIVAIARNLDKGEALFEMEERKEMLEAMTSELDNVSVDIFEGLLVTYCIQRNANAVLRGIRAVSDYEFELQMALMNRKMEPRVETIFMMPAEKYSYLSSRIVREIAKLGGPLNGLVPEMVEQRVRLRIAQRHISPTGKHLL